ncbi:hypothetical protein B0J17DRAFT_327095 [Rhizoctonia solani]|nr:hypothetical protein B0J17DRAFT_327095 [Rhizoctonia solani]
MSNAAYDSLDSAYQTQPGRIYTDPSNPRRPTSSATSVDSSQRNSVGPMVAQRLSCHGRYSSPINPHNGLPAAYISRTKRFSTGSNVPNMPRQQQSQLSFPTPLPPTADITESYTGYHHRASSLATDCRSCNHEASVRMQECYHIHNHLPSRPTSQDFSFPHAYGGASQPRQVHEIPPIPLNHQVVGGNYQGYTTFNPSRNNTEVSYLAPGSYPHGSNSANLRNLTLYESQAAHNCTQIPSASMRYDANVPDGYYHSTQPDLYGIPENVPQSDFGSQWDPVSEAMAANLPSGYGVQPILSNHVQPLPSSNPLVHLAFDYPHAQQPETAFKEPHMSGGVPDLYSQPTRQWTKKVWGNQEHGLPMRTDSPTPLEAPSVDGICPMPQDPSGLRRMPDSHDYVHSRVYNSV